MAGYLEAYPLRGTGHDGYLIGYGLNPGVLTVNFQSAPGYFAWREAGIPLVVRYRYPSGQWIDWSNSPERAVMCAISRSTTPP